MEELAGRFLREFHTPLQNSILVFFIILFIILLAPILLKKVKLPGIVGLIISGVLIGPHGLNLIEKNAAIDLFSTIGLLYIMFLAGLELDLAEFEKKRNKSFVFGILTFLLPISIGLPVCYYLLGYNLQTSLLTASMFATHTLIAYPIVSRLGIVKNEAVALTVGGTILTDTAVLILLAIIIGNQEGGLTLQFGIRLGISLLCFMFLVFIVIPKISSWFFRRLEDEKNAHFIFVLSIIFLCAFISQLAGLESIIGAFVAGLTLNRLIPHTSTLMNRLEFVGNSLFIPFFLISVGMIIDIRVLTRGTEALIVAVALTAVALTGKWLAAVVTGILYRYSWAQRNVIFGLSSSHAAATLAVILVGYKMHIIDDNILNGTIVLIMVTCLVASFVTEIAARKIVLDENSQLSSQPVNVSQQHILVPISNPVTMERLIDFSIAVKDPKSNTPIVGLAVVEDDEMAQNKLLQAQKMLHKAIDHATAAGQTIEISATIDQNVTNGIKRVAKEMFITDIILGWSPHSGLADFIFGKTFDNVVSQTSQSVFITRLTLPLNLHREIHLISPPLTEKEAGFHSWLRMVLQLASNLNSCITFHTTQETNTAIHEFKSNIHSVVSTHSILLTDIMNLLHSPFRAHQNDLIIMISARNSRISYLPILDALPDRLIKQFPDNSFIFVYPQIQSMESISSYTQETGGSLLNKSWGILRHKIFRKNT